MKRSYETPAVQSRNLGLASVIAASVTKRDDFGGEGADRVKARNFGSAPSFDF